MHYWVQCWKSQTSILLPCMQKIWVTALRLCLCRRCLSFSVHGFRTVHALAPEIKNTEVQKTYMLTRSLPCLFLLLHLLYIALYRGLNDKVDTCMQSAQARCVSLSWNYRLAQAKLHSPYRPTVCCLCSSLSSNGGDCSIPPTLWQSLISARIFAVKSSSSLWGIWRETSTWTSWQNVFTHLVE